MRILVEKKNKHIVTDLRKVKGLILIPYVYRVYISDRYMCLFRMLRDKYGFEIKFGELDKPPPQVSPDTDVVIAAHQRLYEKRQENAMMHLADLPSRIKLIGYLGDLDSMSFIPGNDIKMLDRYDLILSPYDFRYKKKYPQYVYKTIYFPNFFAPHERYADLKFNTKPIQKALLIGRLFEPKRYPLRVFINKHRDSKKIDVMEHPKGHPSAKILKNKKYYVGDRYAQHLNQYFACVTCGGLGCVLAKYLEVPATGSLLIANETEDSKVAGFIPYKHYIPITKKNVLSQIDKCLKNPENYTKIRIDGMRFVRKKHSVVNRFARIESWLSKLL